MKFRVVLEWPGVGFAWFCFSFLSSWPQNSLSSSLSLSELFHVGPGVQYTESRSWGLWLEGRLFDLAADIVSFPQEALRRSLSGWPATTCNESNANSFYFKTFHLFICQNAVICVNTDKHIHRYTTSLSVSRSHTNTYTGTHKKNFMDLRHIIIYFSFIYIEDEDLSMKWKWTTRR